MGKFAEILEAIPQEDRAFLDKYPQLKQSIEDLETKNENWTQWANENYDFERQATKAEVSLQDQLAAERERAELLSQQVGTGEDMTFEDIAADLSRRGYIKKTDVDSAIAPHLKAVKDEATTAVNQTALGTEFMYTKLTPKLIHHFQEFNESLDMEGLFKHMKATGTFGDPDAAYNAFVAPKREAKRQQDLEASNKKHQEELDAVRAETTEKVRKETLEQVGMSKLPVDQRGESVTASQSKILASAKKEDGSFIVPEGVQLGDGSLAAIGAEMLRAGKLSDGVH